MSNGAVRNQRDRPFIFAQRLVTHSSAHPAPRPLLARRAPSRRRAGVLGRYPAALSQQEQKLVEDMARAAARWSQPHPAHGAPAPIGERARLIAVLQQANVLAESVPELQARGTLHPDLSRGACNSRPWRRYPAERSHHCNAWLERVSVRSVIRGRQRRSRGSGHTSPPGRSRRSARSVRRVPGYAGC